MFMRWRPIDEAHKEGITIWSDVSISNTFSFRSSTATSYRVLRIVFHPAFCLNGINTICPCKDGILRKFKMFENAAPGGYHISKEMAL